MSNKNYLISYYQRNKEKINARSRARYLAKRDEILAKNKINHALNRERHNETTKRGHYRRLFGLTLEQRNLLLSQGCQICFGVATHIDHCHKTGKVRGGLCNNCNTALGGFKDSPIILDSAKEYLRQGAKNVRVLLEKTS